MNNTTDQLDDLVRWVKAQRNQYSEVIRRLDREEWELRALKRQIADDAESDMESAADPATLDRIRVAAEASEVDPVMPPKFDMQDFAARVCGMQPGADPDPYRHRHAERWDGQS